MDIVGNALESERDAPGVGRWEQFETKFLRIDNAVPGDGYGHGNAEFLQGNRQRAQDIGQTARLGERRTFCCNHQDAKVRHEKLLDIGRREILNFSLSRSRKYVVAPRRDYSPFTRLLVPVRAASPGRLL